MAIRRLGTCDRGRGTVFCRTQWLSSFCIFQRVCTWPFGWCVFASVVANNRYMLSMIWLLGRHFDKFSVWSGGVYGDMPSQFAGAMWPAPSAVSSPVPFVTSFCVWRCIPSRFCTAAVDEFCFQAPPVCGGMLCKKRHYKLGTTLPSWIDRQGPLSKCPAKGHRLDRRDISLNQPALPTWLPNSSRRCLSRVLAGRLSCLDLLGADQWPGLASRFRGQPVNSCLGIETSREHRSERCQK